MLKPGDKAPPFAADSTQGPIDLHRHLGRQPIVLIFYPRDETPGCTAQLCAIRDERQRFAEAGALVLGVNPGTLDQHNAFARHRGYEFPLLSDRGRAINRLYEVGSMIPGLPIPRRTVYVIGRDGLIHFARRGAPTVEEIMEAIRRSDELRSV